MNNRQVIVLWIIALALVTALVAVNSTKSDGYQSSTDRSRGDTLLSDFDPTQVASLKISKGEESVTLIKKEGGWKVLERDDYPAKASAINDVLRTLDEVEVTQGIEAETEFFPRFGMDPSSTDSETQGLQVVLSNDAGTELAQLTFGKNLEAASDPMSPFGGGASGRFVRNHSDNSGVYVISELFPTLDPKPSGWLDDEFVKVEKIRKIAASKLGKPGEFAWKLNREDEEGDFSLEGKLENEQLDTSALDPLKNLFSYARFEDVVPAAEVDGAWDKDKRQQAVIETFEGFTYNVTFGPEKSQEAEESATPNYLMRVTVTASIPEARKVEEGETEEDAKSKQEAFEARKKELEGKLETAKRLEGRTFRVTKFTVDPLLKDRTGLIKSAPPTAPQTGTSPPAPSLGSGGPSTPPATAVTPPVAIPSSPAGESTEGE